ncbi:hypothetical protein BGX33_008481 [Mortierella sp. NVP41]|nr:hypothetical protein BGX33_008481 [Mortierella sp. NVP41]
MSRRPGYLERLGRLTNLEELRGSVYADTDETAVTVGWLEDQWIALHWPRLEVAEFFRHDDEIIEPFWWLQELHEHRQLELSPRSWA